MPPLRPNSASVKKMAAQLVSLPEVERLSPACIRILGGNPGQYTLQGTNTYLVGTGPKRLLIDTAQGKPSWIAALKRTLDQEKASVATVLLTHWHHDHVLGVADLLAHSPGAAVYKCNPDPGWLDIEDGQTFAVDGATLTAVHTPGHTTDHMAFVLREENVLFTGDNVLGQGTAVFEDLATYLKSLERMGTLGAGRGYPGHGPVLPDATAKISEYIAHRQQREKQVLQTLSTSRNPDAPQAALTEPGDAWTAMELVKVIYRDYPENLHLPAVGGIQQILHKLKAEEKIVLEDGDRWRLKDRSRI